MSVFGREIDWDMAGKLPDVLTRLQVLLTPPLHTGEVICAIEVLERTALELRELIGEG